MWEKRGKRKRKEKKGEKRKMGKKNNNLRKAKTIYITALLMWQPVKVFERGIESVG
jgi:hypothetical protein